MIPPRSPPSPTPPSSPPSPTPPSPPPPPPPPPPSFYPSPSEPYRPLICFVYRISDDMPLYHTDINHPLFSDPPMNCYVYRTARDYRLYRVNLHGSNYTVTVTASPSIVDSWVHDVRSHQNRARRTESVTAEVVVVGFDLLRGRPIERGRGTLALCVGSQCLLFQLFHASSVPQSLRDFLSDGLYRFISFEHGDVDGTKEFLACSPHGVDMRGQIVSLRSHLQQQDRKDSVRKIAKEYLKYDVNVTWEIMLSDWGEFILTHTQVIQASIIARCNFLIGLELIYIEV